MKTIKNWLRKQKEDFQEFMVVIGLRTITQQVAVGVTIGLLFLLLACYLAEFFESQY